MPDSSIIIIGAGVLGASSALALQNDGHDVLLVDRDEPCAGASYGNAGAIVNGSAVPTAMPGITFDLLQMLTRPNSPFSIRPGYLPKMLPWLLRFLWQSRSSAATKNGAHLYALSKHAVEGWRRLTDNTQLSSLLVHAGWLKVYESDRTFAATDRARRLLDEVGSRYEILNAGEIRDLEPGLAPIYQYGFYQKDCLNIVNPQRMVQGMVDLFVSRGGAYKQFDVDIIQTDAGEIKLSGSKGSLRADRLVIAAGAWSRPLAKQLGDNVPLDTERGYHLMLPQSTSSLLNRPVVNGESSFVLSPMETGLRMSSQVELAGLDRKPDYTRIRSLLINAQRMVPAINAVEESVWMGFRPSLPDSLPVLGFSTRSDRVLYAFGHQHLGMTLGAISGLIVSDLMSDRAPRVAVYPYRPDRFSRL